MNEEQIAFMNDMLSRVATEVGKEVGLTGDQLLAHLVMGDRRHPNAPVEECGMISPHDDTEQTWCRMEVDHDGDHRPWKAASGWPKHRHLE